MLSCFKYCSSDDPMTYPWDFLLVPLFFLSQEPSNSHRVPTPFKITRDFFLSCGYCSLLREIIEAHEGDNVSRSSNSWGCYSLLECCGVTRIPKCHKGSPYSPRAFSLREKVLIHYGTLEGGHQTRTSLGKSPQLNWRLPSDVSKIHPLFQVLCSWFCSGISPYMK
jgi:hypothetical protein